MEIQTDDFTNVVQKILNFRDFEGTPHIDKFNKDWILMMIGEKNEIQLIEKQFQESDPQGLDLVDFTRAFLNIIPHQETETLYICAGLIDLFKDICETFELKEFIKSVDVLNYLVENLTSKEWSTHRIPTKKLPMQKKFDTSQDVKIRNIDIEAPIIYGPYNANILRVLSSKLTIDNTHHDNSIKRASIGTSVKKFFTLDSLSDTISVYNMNCILEKKIASKTVDDKSLEEKKDVMILDFSWSDKQQRIGATLKDFTLSFWEFSDSFDFEKRFNIANWVPDYQIHIWFIEFLNVWVTTDKTNALHVWDLEKEAKIYSLSSPNIKSKIIDLIVLDLLKLVAVSSMDKRITIWDFSRKRVVIELDLTQGGIHTMAWSNSYQVLVTAGYENKINLWSINPSYLDVTLIGSLTGHISMVNAVEVIEKTPMIVSADDLGKLKVWDLRDLNCVQTVDFGHKVTINKIISAYEFGKLCFAGSRISLLSFDNPVEASSKSLKEEQVWPIAVEYNYNVNELVICTRKDIRFLDVSTGRLKKIYRGLLDNDEDEITAFKLVQHDKKFLLGDHRGHVCLYSYSTGEKIKSFASHANEITVIKIDLTNKMILSGSWDSNIFVQKETNIGFELKKSAKNLHYKKEVSLLEISPYHNLLASASSSNFLYIWDYEFLKLMATLEIDPGTEFTCLTFLNEYPLMIAADSSGKIHILCFHRKEGFNITFKRIALIEIQPDVSFQTSLPSENTGPNFVNKILIEVSNPDQSQDTYKMTLYASTNKGEINIYDLSEIAQDWSVHKVPHANTRMNYNSNRIAHENFLTQVEGYKIKNYFLGVRTLLVLSGGDFIDSDRIAQNNWKPTQFKTHQDSLTTLAFIKNPEKALLTSSLDGYVKIWTVQGQLKASLNINHPLPVLWNFKNDDFSKNKKKVLCALKLIDNVMRRHKNQMLLSEQKNVSVNTFLKSFISPNSRGSDQGNLHQISSARSENVLLMKNEYSPRDLQFEKAKIIYQKELQGPSLKQIEVTHRLAEAQRAWKNARKNEVERNDEIGTKIKELDDKREKNDFMKLLIGDVSRKFLTESEYSQRTQALGRRLEKLSLGKTSPKKVRNDSMASSKPRESIFITDHSGKKTSNFPPLQLTTKVSDLRENNFPSEPKTSKLSLKSTEMIPTSSIISPRSNGDPKANFMKEEGQTSIYAQEKHSKLNLRPNFIEYAKEKLYPDNESQIDTVRKASITEVRSDQYKRKLQRLEFKKTVTKLDRILKLSQTSKLPLKNLPQKIPNFSQSITDKSLTFRETPVVDLQNAFKSKPEETKAPEQELVDPNIHSNLSPIPRQMTIGRVKSLDGPDTQKILTFKQELTGLKGFLESNWNLKLNKNGMMMKDNFSSLSFNKSRQFDSQVNQSTNNTFREISNATRNNQNFTAFEKSKADYEEASRVKSVLPKEIKPLVLKKRFNTEL